MTDEDYLRYIFDTTSTETECPNEDKGCKTTCCCGGDIDHPWDGHSPVSMHHWYCEGACEREYGRS